MIYRELLKKGAVILSENGIEDASFDACQLMQHLKHTDRSGLSFIACSDADADTETEFLSLISRRAQNEPLQYIIGEWDFYDGTFFVGPGVLIPRPETEQLASMCIEEAKKRGKCVVFDLCAGTGCIGLTIAKHCPSAEVYLFEKFDEAFFYLKKNTDASGLSNVCAIQADVKISPSDNLPLCDILVSNPPYIPSGELASLQNEVKKEPVSALDGGEDGLDFYIAIARSFRTGLAANAFIAFECGENQADKIAEIYSVFGRTDIISDVFGTRRFISVYL